MKQVVAALTVMALAVVGCEEDAGPVQPPTTARQAPADTLLLGTEEHPADSIVVMSCFDESSDPDVERRLCRPETVEVDGALLVRVE